MCVCGVWSLIYLTGECNAVWQERYWGESQEGLLFTWELAIVELFCYFSALAYPLIKWERYPPAPVWADDLMGQKSSSKWNVFFKHGEYQVLVFYDPQKYLSLYIKTFECLEYYNYRIEYAGSEKAWVQFYS